MEVSDNLQSSNPNSTYTLTNQLSWNELVEAINLRLKQSKSNFSELVKPEGV